MRRGIAAYAFVLVLVTGVSAGCAGRAPSQVHATAAVPLPPRTAPTPTVLPAGAEAMYDLVDTGTLAAANDLLDNVWDVPRSNPVTLPTPLTWTEDPYHDQYWRFLFYSLRPTSNLLWAYYTTKQPKYLDKLLEILTSFTAYDATDPARDRTRLDYPHGAAFREMILVDDYVKLSASGVLPAALATAMRASIARLGAFLVTPANFNASYNHGFTEVVALLLVAVNFPDLPGATGWRALALDRLSTLMHNTVGPDGVEIERSPFYHFYVFDFALQLQAWSVRTGISMPASLADSINSMARYSTDIIWPNGQIPLLGSSVQLRPSGNTALYANIEKSFPQFAFAVTSGAKGTPPEDRAALFGTSGQVVMRSPIDASKPYSDNTQLQFTAGPPSTAHSHLDSLALTLYAHGTVLLPDSGLDTYVAGTAFDFFHGTSAHNTIVVDGKDQGAGPVTAGLVTSGPDWEYASAVASQYPGVTQKRSVLMIGHNALLVVDSLSSNAPHSYQQLWHLFPGANVTTSGLTVRATTASDAPVLEIVSGRSAAATPALSLQTYYGATDPLQGWYSDAYGQVQKNHVVGYTQSGTDAAYYTLIAAGPDAAHPASVTESPARNGALRLTVCAADVSDLVTITDQAAGAGAGEHVTVVKNGGCPHGN
jgi:Heparinase II/III-like protein/Heparinase II/III N-terminus